MRHSDIWNGIDALAARHGLSVSALARAAGLDATAFNKSKRASADGSKPRWPSTESLSKALAAVGTGWEEFADMAQGRQGRTIPLIGLAQAGDGGFFDDAGFPVGASWDDIHFPDMGDETVYALEISGDSMEPVFREGDRIIVAPGMDVRRGDRVVAKTKEGEVLAKFLGHLSASRVELISANPAYPPREFAASDIEWIARILWASQ
ncbi:S24 family peptidase [Hirschia baltica]|uniref:Putative phage repressor n=1 Tax=Hirschia baltica (strain ATCC 49814 / DSM 5838 / IFAM 1418) TaxID=582402 RepID=C6XM86_HIRBI|nr:helix-turn-helix transcriptional regulator [Hirschia baltica]ACT58029.1 putative phage repressor [Hirschia baltica ATCC 49814]